MLQYNITIWFHFITPAFRKKVCDAYSTDWARYLQSNEFLLEELKDYGIEGWARIYKENPGICFLESLGAVMQTE